MRRNFLFGCLLSGCIAACGGTAELAGTQVVEDGGGDAALDVTADSPVTPEAGSDASIADGSVADAPVDAAPGEFCSGNAKAMWGATRVDSPVITTSALVMDCCEGAEIRIHTKAALGFDYAVDVVSGWPMTPGEYVLGGDAGLPNVSVGVLGETSQKIPATGTLHVGDAASSEMRLGFCLDVLSEHIPGGSKLYVPEAFVAPYQWQLRLGLYLLSDATITATQALTMPLESLPLAQEPVVDLMNLGWYGAATHFVHWGGWSSTAILLSKVGQIPVQGVPFVVVADGQRIYLGSFMTMVSSYAIDTPVIMKEEMTEEGFLINPPMKAPDPRSDPRVIKVLQESWKLGP